MNSLSTRSREDEDWLAPRAEVEGLQRYFETLRDRWWVVLLALVLALGGAGFYLYQAPKVYEATSQILVTPVPQGDATTIGLGLIEASNDPTRDVTTAAQFITTPSVAAEVLRKLHLPGSSTGLLGRVSAQPVALSSLVDVTASAPTAAEAAKLADAFASVTISQRTNQLHAQIARLLPRLQQQVNLLPDAQKAASPLTARLGTLQSLDSQSDPTLRQTVSAAVPDNPSSPRPKITLAAGLLAGLILGFGAAFLLQSIDPRVRREEQLRSIWRVPILTRVPAESGTRRASALAPGAMSGAATEAYRTLRATLAASHGDGLRSRSIMVTGSSPSEGKSTTAMNFAHSLVQAGSRVILIEADFHRPTIGAALGVRPRYGIGSVLVRQVALADALVTTEEYGPDLQLLLVERPGVGMADRLSLPTARQLVADAEALADYVVIDSPPLTEVGDTLSLAQDVGDILVVVRLGRTKIKKLLDLGEMLAHYGLHPAGIALVGVDRSKAAGYYYTDRDEAPDPDA
ncbi:MAG: tyrosine-protein kinase [Solirubrobacteraceae bacterium]|nr:tyrosine-protein kinase [Solirubrobacteraceae bacterium]